MNLKAQNMHQIFIQYTIFVINAIANNFHNISQSHQNFILFELSVSGKSCYKLEYLFNKIFLET